MPLGRRADKVQAQRRTVELRRLRHQYETTLHSLGMEVGAAVREVKANWVEFESRQLAPLATQPTDSGRIQLVEPHFICTATLPSGFKAHCASGQVVSFRVAVTRFSFLESIRRRIVTIARTFN